MIETKEEYEEVKEYLWKDASIIELIESLRNVARAADEVRHAWGHDIGDYGFSNRLAEALDALPQWVLEEE